VGSILQFGAGVITPLAPNYGGDLTLNFGVSTTTDCYSFAHLPTLPPDITTNSVAAFAILGA
jgi:hypothetical protein